MNRTQVQVRYPFGPAIQAGFGLHDDSFAYATLDGVYNGGVDVGWCGVVVGHWFVGCP